LKPTPPERLVRAHIDSSYYCATRSISLNHDLALSVHYALLLYLDVTISNIC